MFAAWQDSRNDASLDVWAQRVDAAGARQWDAEGVPVSTGPGAQLGPAIAASPLGGALVAWQDGRGGVSTVTGLQRFSGAGAPLWTLPPVVSGGPARAGAGLSLAAVHRNPTRGELGIAFALPDAGPARLELFDLAGRRVAVLEVRGVPGVARTATWRPAHLRAGLHVLRLVHGSGTRSAKVVVVP